MVPGMFIAGEHGLVSLMTLRLAQPAVLINIGRGLTLACLVVLGVTGCRDQPAAPTPQPLPQHLVTPLDRTGPVQITYIGANIPPGSSVPGCGSSVEGCAGRLRLTFRLEPPASGPVLYMRVYLHATNLLACLWGETPAFALQAGSPIVVDIPFDYTADCRTPTTIATMAAVIEGTQETASRQTWEIRYLFAP